MLRLFIASPQTYFFWLQVCGANGKTYQNKCKATRAGIRRTSKGRCSDYGYEESDHDYEESDMEMEETEEVAVPETGNPSLRGGAVLAD